MLLVEDSMTREVATVSPEATAVEALALCRERRIRHLPVLDSDTLVGIVSDRDLRSATPALGDTNRAAALEEIRARDVMSREVLTAFPDDPIEKAANVMRERKVGCLPVIGGGELVGIITSSDVMEALVHLVGAHEPGSRLGVSLPDRPGALAGVAGILGMCEVNIISVVTGPRRDSSQAGAPPERSMIFRVSTINPGEMVGYLKEAGYTVFWPPQP